MAADRRGCIHNSCGYSETSDLTPAQDKALILILAGRPLGSVAAEVGVDPSTLRSWRNTPIFREALRQARERAMEAALAALQAAALRAVAELVAILDDPEAPAGTRCQAAGLLLSNAIKAGEADLERRVAALEEAATNVA